MDGNPTSKKRWHKKHEEEDRKKLFSKQNNSFLVSQKFLLFEQILHKTEQMICSRRVLLLFAQSREQEKFYLFSWISSGEQKFLEKKFLIKNQLRIFFLPSLIKYDEFFRSKRDIFMRSLCGWWRAKRRLNKVPVYCLPASCLPSFRFQLPKSFLKH